MTLYVIIEIWEGELEEYYRTRMSSRRARARVRAQTLGNEHCSCGGRRCAVRLEMARVRVQTLGNESVKYKTLCVCVCVCVCAFVCVCASVSDVCVW